MSTITASNNMTSVRTNHADVDKASLFNIMLWAIYTACLVASIALIAVGSSAAGIIMLIFTMGPGVVLTIGMNTLRTSEDSIGSMKC